MHILIQVTVTVGNGVTSYHLLCGFTGASWALVMGLCSEPGSHITLTGLSVHGAQQVRRLELQGKKEVLVRCVVTSGTITFLRLAT